MDAYFALVIRNLRDSIPKVLAQVIFVGHWVLLGAHHTGLDVVLAVQPDHEEPTS